MKPSAASFGRGAQHCALAKSGAIGMPSITMPAYSEGVVTVHEG
jgi:hypothetical protein